MIAIDPDKRALLEAAERLCMADLITITTRTGVVLRHTSADVDLYVEGEYFDSSLRWERDRLSIKAGLEMSSLQITIFPQETDMIGGLKLSQAARAGVLDGADFLLERAFFIPDWDSYQFKIVRFGGRFADIEDFSRSEIPITVNSHLEILNVNMPREVYQPSCRRVLYGDGCDVDRTLFATTGTVPEASPLSPEELADLAIARDAALGYASEVKTDFLATSGTDIQREVIGLDPNPYGYNLGDVVLRLQIESGLNTTNNILAGSTAASTAALQVAWYAYLVLRDQYNAASAPSTAQVIHLDLDGPDRAFALGTITGTSGANDGITRTVKNYAGGIFTVVEPFPTVPVPGDTFIAHAGCDRQFATCRDVFECPERFSGEPFVPAAETAY